MPLRKNLYISEQKPLPSPKEVLAELPMTPEDYDDVEADRDSVRRILDREDKRFVLIVGPCSIHNEAEALDYARHLKKISEEVQDTILILMRTYFEKPRTTLGWKGLIYDPEINGTYNIEEGIKIARRLLLEIVEIGVPVATEILDPFITQYLADLISWAAIGARTTESQPHRQLVSGLSMPTGFKNGTDGSVKVAVEAIKTANAKHSFIGVLDDGHAGVFRTLGNPYAHLILRGGTNGPNFESEYITFSRELMKKHQLKPRIIVDCSHGNSQKVPENQILVMRNIIKQINDGEDAIVGAMIESNLESGNQKVVSGEKPQAGLSITDACIGWEETECLIKEIHQSLS